MLSQIFSVLSQNIFPIFLVAFAGYLLQRRANLDPKTLNSVAFNILSPCLVFSSLVNSNLLIHELGGVALFTVLCVGAMGAVALLVSRLLRLDRMATSAFLLVIMFANGGNYGMTLNQLRYGDDGLSRAVIYYVVSTAMVYSVGVAIASLGKLTWRQTVARMLRIPAVYATILAIIIYSFQLTVPKPILAGVQLAGSAAIPVMLLILGMQIAGIQPGQLSRMVWPAVGTRLLIGPLVAVAVAMLVGLQGLTRNTSIIEASTPTAVINIVLATEFGLPATQVATIVVISTLLSPLTLSAVITVLGL